MRVRSLDSLPHELEHTENVFIPMSDGCRLAARVWRPAGSEHAPVPGVLEYIPYRKRDLKRDRDTLMHPYVAAHGYACVRVDLRGSGDSDGVLADEYLEQELADGEEVLNWIAEQPWCSGSVGMIGISWGGFNGLQIAARRPAALKAIVTVCSTDDRYRDDVHYMGGCLLGDNLSWASVMFAFNSMPPDPEVVGDRWREMWFERLEHSGLWLDTWLRHQHRDAYWQHGSICEDYSDVQVPVLAVSGWADGYSNAVFRMLENLEGPRMGLIGPWSHKYPNLGVPGPAIGFLQETVRWWDHWLKDVDTGIMDEPMLRAYLLDSVAPTTQYDHRPGRWVTEPSWPAPTIEQQTWVLGGRWRLVPEGVDTVVERELTVQSPLTLGLFAGKWCSYSATPDLPHDQREEDGGALVFESPPLEEDLEILGAPTVELVLASERPVAMVAVRLSDTAPDDKATRVTYGLLNLTHRDGHEHPEPLVPGEPVRVRLALNDVGYSFPAGHRLRLAVSTSYWPLAWLPPQSAKLTLSTGDSRLHLPVRPHRPDDDVRFEEVENAPPLETTALETGEHTWVVHRDLATDTSTLAVINDNGIRRIEEIDLEVEDRVREWYSTVADDFTSARGEVESVRGLRRGDWDIRTVTRTTLTCDTSAFHVHAELDAYEGDERVFSRNFSERIPRQLL